MRSFGSWICLVMGVGLVGCSGSEPRAYPVELTVSVKGRPPVGATVVLHPIGASDPAVPRPTGRVDEAGTVRFSTFAQGDGAPPGDYTVTVEWRDEVTVMNGPDKVRELSADKLHGKYAKPAAATAPRVTVEKQPNTLPPLQL